MIKEFTHNGIDYIVTRHVTESTLTLNVRRADDKSSLLELGMQIDDIVDARVQGKDYGPDVLCESLISEFKCNIDNGHPMP